MMKQVLLIKQPTKADELLSCQRNDMTDMLAPNGEYYGHGGANPTVTVLQPSGMGELADCARFITARVVRPNEGSDLFGNGDLPEDCPAALAVYTPTDSEVILWGVDDVKDPVHGSPEYFLSTESFLTQLQRRKGSGFDNMRSCKHAHVIGRYRSESNPAPEALYLRADNARTAAAVVLALSHVRGTYEVMLVNASIGLVGNADMFDDLPDNASAVVIGFITVEHAELGTEPEFVSVEQMFAKVTSESANGLQRLESLMEIQDVRRAAAFRARREAAGGGSSIEAVLNALFGRH